MKVPNRIIATLSLPIAGRSQEPALVLVTTVAPLIVMAEIAGRPSLGRNIDKLRKLFRVSRFFSFCGLRLSDSSA